MEKTGQQRGGDHGREIVGRQHQREQAIAVLQNLAEHAARRPPLSVSAWILASSAETSAISLAAENACSMMHATTASAMPMVSDHHRRSLTCSTVAPRTRSAMASKSPIFTDSPARGTRRSVRKIRLLSVRAPPALRKPSPSSLRSRLISMPPDTSHSRVAHFGQLGTFEVELVANFAEQFFEQVFQRHQAQQLAEFVDHQRHP